MSDRRTSGDEAGMTLIEMLISMVVLAIIVVPLTTTVYLLLVGTSNARQTTADSSTAQLMSSYFGADIASSASATYNSAPDTCGAQVPNATSMLWSFKWSDPAVAAQVDESDYVMSKASASASTSTILDRVYCTITTAPAVTTLVSQVALVQNVSSTPTPSCVPACTSTPQQITQQIVVQAPTERTAYYSSYTYSLTGTRRVQP